MSMAIATVGRALGVQMRNCYQGHTYRSLAGVEDR